MWPESVRASLSVATGGNVLSLNTFSTLSRSRRDPVGDRVAEQDVDRRLLTRIERQIRVLDIAGDES